MVKVNIGRRVVQGEEARIHSTHNPQERNRAKNPAGCGGPLPPQPPLSRRSFAFARAGTTREIRVRARVPCSGRCRCRCGDVARRRDRRPLLCVTEPHGRRCRECGGVRGLRTVAGRCGVRVARRGKHRLKAGAAAGRRWLRLWLLRRRQAVAVVQEATLMMLLLRLLLRNSLAPISPCGAVCVCHCPLGMGWGGWRMGSMGREACEQREEDCVEHGTQGRRERFISSFFVYLRFFCWVNAVVNQRSLPEGEGKTRAHESLDGIVRV